MTKENEIKNKFTGRSRKTIFRYGKRTAARENATKQPNNFWSRTFTYSVNYLFFHKKSVKGKNNIIALLYIVKLTNKNSPHIFALNNFNKTFSAEWFAITIFAPASITNLAAFIFDIMPPLPNSDFPEAKSSISLLFCQHVQLILHPYFQLILIKQSISVCKHYQ